MNFQINFDFHVGTLLNALTISPQLLCSQSNLNHYSVRNFTVKYCYRGLNATVQNPNLQNSDMPYYS